MKKIQLKLAAVLLILAGNLISCEDKEIPFTEYSLSGTHCRWTYYGDNVLIVNSVEELEKYITIYIEDGYYPEIDFSKNTLLLVTGVMPQMISYVKAEAFTHCGDKYELKGNIYMGNLSAMIPDRWFLSILVPKLTVDTVINSNINVVILPDS